MYFWTFFYSVFKFALVLSVLQFTFVSSSTDNGVSYYESNCDQTMEPPKISPVLPASQEYITEPHELPLDFVANGEHNSWSNLVFQDCKGQFEFLCSAKYPVEWIELYDKDIDQLTETSDHVYKNLWTDRIVNDSMSNNSLTSITNPELISYSAFLGITYRNLSKNFCFAANYSCRSVDYPACLRSNIVSIVNSTKNTIAFQPTNASIDVDTTNARNKPCKGIITVTAKSDTPGWQCTSLLDQQYVVYLKTCDAAVNCNTYFPHHKQMCVKRLSLDEDCIGCRYANASKFTPGFVYCFDGQNEIVTALQYFFSVPQTTKLKAKPELYLSWDEADPQKMLYLEPLYNEIFLGEFVTIFCRVSRYYFSYGHRFGFEFGNGTMVYSPAIDGEHDTVMNFNRLNTTFHVDDPTLQKIYCFAPVWNSTLWINQSFEVTVNQDPSPPELLLNGMDKSTDVTFVLHQRNASLSCKVKGNPMPNIVWTWKSQDVSADAIEMEPGRKNLVFPIVTHATAGVYTCETANFMGKVTKTVNVIVRDEFAYFVQLTTIFGVILIVGFIMIITLCWTKIRKQRQQLRALTEAEIKEFREGNLEILENRDCLDTQELLHALPYNDKFEIRRDDLQIDFSAVLGSGNFGQVVKGTILSGQGSPHEVAVKTLKQKYDISYFKSLLSEVKIMAYIGHHSNVVSLVGACTQNISKREIYIAVQYCAKGNLEKFLKACRPTFVSLISNDTIYINTSFQNTDHTYENCKEETTTNACVSTVHLIKWSREIANGMEFLGSKKVVHGDLACRNILLTKDLVAKIGDFGLSRQLRDYSNYVRSDENDCVLPWKWMAFETLHDMKFSAMSDVWSYGVTIWEIFSLGQLPYPGITWSSTFIDHLKNGLRLHKPAYGDSHIYNVMLECWLLDPIHRPKFTELKDFFEGLLLQNCSDDYIDTKSSGNPRQYINQTSFNLEAHNPSYATFGTGNRIHPVSDECNTPTRVKIFRFSNGNQGKMVTASEDDQGYLRPLIGFVEETET